MFLTQFGLFYIIPKAKILEEVVAYAKSFSRNIGHNFNSRTIVLTALTGTAAVEIGGQTTASVFKYLRKKTHATQADIDYFIDSRIAIIDECSFAGWGTMAKTSENMKNFTQCRDYEYGNMDFVFLGDFCQLEAMNGDCLYEHPDGVYWEHEINCLVELFGNHRFKNCNYMGNICSAMRNGCLSEELRDLLNSRVIGQNGVEMPDPKSIRFATYCNKLRCSLNSEIFKMYLKKHHSWCTETNICQSAIVIKANASWEKSKIVLTFGQRKILFEECSEANTRNKRNTKCDPLLCLCEGSNVMVNENADVANGIANGTNCLFRYAKLKPGAILEPLMMHGFWVYSVAVNDVEYLELEWQDASRFKGTFQVHSKKAMYVVDFPMPQHKKRIRLKTKMILEQFPVVINFATTGHKLQGKSLVSLVIAEWTDLKNWAYVVISRVCTLMGLFLLSPIPENYIFTPPKAYLEMMDRLRHKFLAKPEDVADLKATYNCNWYAGNALN